MEYIGVDCNVSGLCNRLMKWQLIYEIAKMNNKRVMVIWNKEFKYLDIPNTVNGDITNLPDLKKFKSVVLRNSGGDFNKSNFRDGLMTHLATETGLVTQAFQPVVVYINGEYWGIQNLREKINEHFVEANFDVDKDSIDIVRHRYDVQHGSSKEYHKLLKYLKY